MSRENQTIYQQETGPARGWLKTDRGNRYSEKHAAAMRDFIQDMHGSDHEKSFLKMNPF
jgi:hypothetical protein